MANYAYNSIVFITTEDHLLDLEFLYTNIMYGFDTNKSSSVNLILNPISEAYDTKVYKFDGRDCISWISEEFDFDEDRKLYSFTVEFESAWELIIGRIQTWVESISPYIWTVGIGEEPGFELYANTDTEGIFFTSRYVLLRFDDSPDEYLDTVEEAVNILESAYPDLNIFKDIIDRNSYEEVNNVLSEYNKSAEPEQQIYLNRYEDIAYDEFGEL